MLNQKSIEAIAKASGIKADELAKAIKSEGETSIEVNVAKSFTSDEWNTFESEVDKENKRKYDEGKEVGQNQLIKDLKMDAGLEYEGKKREDFVERFKTKVLEEADKNPDKKITELQNDIKTLREVELPEKDKKINELNTKLKTTNVLNKISQFIPSKLPAGLNKSDAKTIIRNNFEFDFDEDGNEVVKKDGEVLKDKTRKNVSFKDAITDFTTERKWVVNDGGRGGDDDTGKKKASDYKGVRSMGEMEEYFEENNISPLSSKARSMIVEANKAAKDAGEEFDYEK